VSGVLIDREGGIFIVLFIEVVIPGRWTWHTRIANHAATFQGSNKKKQEY